MIGRPIQQVPMTPSYENRRDGSPFILSPPLFKQSVGNAENIRETVSSPMLTSDGEEGDDRSSKARLPSYLYIETYFSGSKKRKSSMYATPPRSNRTAGDSDDADDYENNDGDGGNDWTPSTPIPLARRFRPRPTKIRRIYSSSADFFCSRDDRPALESKKTSQEKSTGPPTWAGVGGGSAVAPPPLLPPLVLSKPYQHQGRRFE